MSDRTMSTSQMEAFLALEEARDERLAAKAATPYDTSHVGSACCEGPVTTSGIGFACMLCGKEVGWFPAGTIPEPHYNAIELLKYKLTLSGPNGLIHEVAFAVFLKNGNHAKAALFNINDLLRLAETDALETANPAERD